VLWAGILWILYGILQLGSIILSLALAPDSVPQLACSVLFGIAFAYCGYQTVTGAAKDTLGNALGSLFFGLLAAGLAVVVLIAPNPQGGALEKMIGLLAIGLSTSILIAAGILALVGRSDYLAWRTAERQRDQADRRS
jgi:hypothetical protein